MPHDALISQCLVEDYSNGDYHRAVTLEKALHFYNVYNCRWQFMSAV